MRKSIVTGIAALLVFSLGASASAVAASPSQFDKYSISVSFADLNVQNAAGAKVLYARLRAAAESVCGVKPYSETKSLTLRAASKKCYAETLDEAVADIDSEALQQIHAS